MTYTFPSNFFAPVTAKAPHLQGASVSSGSTVAGPIQMVSTGGGGLWAWEYGGINLNRRDKLLGWRAFVSLIDGGVLKMVVPLVDLRQAPVPLSGGAPYYGGDMPHSDGTVFSEDGLGYRDGIVAATSTGGAASLRATALTATFTAGGALLAGMHFSIDHSVQGRRLYRIVTTPVALGGGAYSFKIRPPLRQAIPNGITLDFDRPGCLMRCSNAEEIADTVELLRFGTAPTIKFLEAF